MIQIEILTLNIHKGITTLWRKPVIDELRACIRSVSSDIVFLQEVIGEHHRFKNHTKWSIPQYEFLADSIWTHYAYGKNAMYIKGHHGNAVLSKYPIVFSHHERISSNKLEQRGFLHCIVDLVPRKTQLHLICVHLGLLKSWRHAQLAKILTYIEQTIGPDLPLILSGDFNDWDLSIHKKLAHLDYKEAHQEITGVVARTFPIIRPTLKMDRIYLRGIQVQHAERYDTGIWANLSDHAALGARVSV